MLKSRLFDSISTVRANRRLTILVLAGLSACSSVQIRCPDGSIDYKSKDDFAHYVEEVFRYHNRVEDDLITATAFMNDIELDKDSPLVRAEEATAKSCHLLNDAVSATIEGRELGLLQKLQLPEVVPACEKASQVLEALLPPPK